MIHNDVLRRLRYALAINDTAAISIFKLVDYDMEMDYLHAVMKKEGEPGYLPCRDKIISLFLDGLIVKNRGKQEGSEPRVLDAGERLSNNEILRKIRIALSYKDDDMIDALKRADFRISKGELSAFFRKPDHRNFKPAGDQVVRNLLQGMVKKYRPEASGNRNSKSNTGASTLRKEAKGKPSRDNASCSKENHRQGSKPANRDGAKANSVWGKITKPTR
ncbi:DUF1456 family protein [Alteromonas gracilis]|uniref:DUF1456 family protein n=1 Tax=Alteromonas gracilis TaxID=1479524 RepID=UPI003219AD25